MQKVSDNEEAVMRQVNLETGGLEVPEHNPAMQKAFVNARPAKSIRMAERHVLF